MIYKIGFFLLLIFFLYPRCFAQITISGTVTDSLKKPINNAIISLKTGNLIIKFSHSNQQGEYSFNTQVDTTGHYVIEARCFGYKTEIIGYKQNSAHNFVLKEGAIDLGDVNVKHKPIVTQNGDTLNYRTADYANQNDRNIGDVLKKVPGINVAENGKISYNNKPISNLYIDGDNLLDDKYNVGTKSIQHKVVTHIQVIDRDQPIKMLQKINLSTDIAINLVIDKAAMLKVMGNAKVGAGLPHQYDENVDLMLFKPNIKFLDNISGNNIGVDISDDVISHNNSNFGGNDRPKNQISTGVSSVPYIQKNRYLLNNSGIVNMNYLYKLSPDKQIRTNIYYLHDGRKQQNSYVSSYYLPQDTINYAEQQYNKTQNQGVYSLVNYVDNSSSHYINNKLTIEYLPQKNQTDILGVEMSFRQALFQKSNNVSNELKYLQTLKSGNILNINSFIEQNTQSEHLSISPGINITNLNQGIGYQYLKQNVNTPGYFTNNYISYIHTRGNFTQSLQTGFSFQHINFDTELFKILYNSNSQTIANGSNTINWSKLKLYFMPQLDYRTEAVLLTFYVPISYYYIDYGISYHRIIINPSVNLRYNFDQENRLNASYNFNRGIGKIENIFDGYLLKSYRSLFSNNSELPFYKTNSVVLGYRYQRAVNLFFANAQVSFTHSLYNSILQSAITNVATVFNSIAMQNSTNQFNLSASVGKYFSRLGTNLALDANTGISTGRQLQNFDLFPYENKTYSIGINSNSNITKRLSLDYRGIYYVAKNKINNQSNFKLSQLKQNIAVNTKLFKDVRFNFNVNHYFIHQYGQENLNYFFNDVAIKYNWLKIKTDFELGINNVANITKFNSYYLNANNYIFSEYEIQGRFLLLKASFVIN